MSVQGVLNSYEQKIYRAVSISIPHQNDAAAGVRRKMVSIKTPRQKRMQLKDDWFQ